MTRHQERQSRTSVLVIFDAFYGSRDNLVGSYLSLVLAALSGTKELHCLTKEPFRGSLPIFADCKIRFFTDIDAPKIKSGKRRGLGKRIKSIFKFEPSAFWLTSMSGDFEVITRLMFDVDNYHAVICFTQSTSLALAVARLAHVFSGPKVPHMFCVTRRMFIPKVDYDDLAWLNMCLLHDNELTPAIDISRKPSDVYLFVRPYSGMAMKAVGRFAERTFERLRSRLGFTRRPTILHYSDVLHETFALRMKGTELKEQEEFGADTYNTISSKPDGLKVSVSGEMAVELLNNTSGVPSLSFFDDSQYPLRENRASASVDWTSLLDRRNSYPVRIRKIVLFVRPDWEASGSNTSFNNFKSYFRKNESLCIELALWPYFVPFTDAERKTKLITCEKHGGPALSFFLRRSGGLAQHLKAFVARRRLKPKTLSGELLLYYVGAAAPRFMSECLENARINTVFINHYFTQEYIAGFLSGRKFYLDTHDIQATNAIHHLYRNPFTTRIDRFEDLLKEEISFLQRAERISFVSPAELNMVKGSLLPERTQYFIPLPIIEKPSPARELAQRPKMIFVASDNLANQQNMNWFIHEVWPNVLKGAKAKGFDQFELEVVGDIKAQFPNFSAPKMRFVGRVESLKDIYDASDLIVLPIVAGGGVAIKTLEAIMYHKAFVATRHAMRGLPNYMCEELNPFDESYDFAARILTLLTDKVLHKQQRNLSVAAAKRLINENFYARLTDSLDAVRLDNEL